MPDQKGMQRAGLLIILLGLITAGWPGRTRAQKPTSGDVLRLRLADEAITPVTARYIGRGVRAAEMQRAEALVLVLDTPGGLMQATQQIVRTLLDSSVPVVVYVAPAGARAASAGVFITLSAHVAAMAPGTHIGAAHPVSVGGGMPGAPSDTAQGTSVMGEKVVNDAVAWARALAEVHGRNAEWAARAVTESASITSSEAVDLHVVDLVADDLQILLTRIDGRRVAVQGDSVQLSTAGATVRPLDMWWGEQVLGVLSNPNVAFLLLMLGFYGLLFEFYTPGWGVGGTLGAIALVLAFFGLSVLPVNYAGLALIALALGMFVAEAFIASFGALTLGGGICLVLGGLMLVDTPVKALQVSAWVVVPVALATAVIAFFLMGSVVQAMRKHVQTGSEGMVGATAVAVEPFADEGSRYRKTRYRGTVRTHGELWRATCPHPVAEGDPLTIKDRDGLTLIVEATDEQPFTSISPS